MSQLHFKILTSQELEQFRSIMTETIQEVQVLHGHNEEVALFYYYKPYVRNTRFQESDFVDYGDGEWGWY